MLGKAFFSLSHDLEAAVSFDAVVKLLGRGLPPLIGADSVFVFETCGSQQIRAAYGDGEIPHRVGSHLDDFNRLLPDHPLFRRVDFRSPGELGVAVSDHVSPEEYRKCEFNRLLHGGNPADDGIIGKLAACCQRTSFVAACREHGVFSLEQREIFDAILFTARTVLARIGSMGVETTVRNFLMATAGRPIGVFVVRPDAEVLPVSHEAVQLSEQWWSQDEPTRALSDGGHRELRETLRDAWTDPVTASFQEVELDMGGGPRESHALPKTNGEILVFVPVSGHLPSGDEALKAVLTRRQREIMEWIAEGKTSAETAIILDISPRTVEKHLEAVFQRLGVENRISAVRRFLDLKSGQAT